MIKNLLYKLSLINRLFKSRYTSYTVTTVDSLVNYIFKDKKKGIYLDIGCQNPVTNNNTLLLHKRGWSGYNIDMDKKNIDLFNLKRPNDVNICVAVSDREGEADMYHYHDGSPINTIEKKLAESRKYQNYKIKKTRTISINKIVEDYKIEELDYVNIDTEGSEYKILKNFNFAVRPIIFSIEFLDIELNRQELIYNKIENVLKSDIYNLFIRNDYKFINWLHQDLIFVDKKFLN